MRWKENPEWRNRTENFSGAQGFWRFQAERSGRCLWDHPRPSARDSAGEPEGLTRVRQEPRSLENFQSRAEAEAKRRLRGLTVRKGGVPRRIVWGLASGLQRILHTRLYVSNRAQLPLLSTSSAAFLSLPLWNMQLTNVHAAHIGSARSKLPAAAQTKAPGGPAAPALLSPGVSFSLVDEENKFFVSKDLKICFQKCQSSWSWWWIYCRQKKMDVAAGEATHDAAAGGAGGEDEGDAPASED